MFHLHPLAYTHACASHQSFPRPIIAAAQEEQFHASSSFFLRKDARRNNARLIQYEQIARVQVVGHISKDAMYQFIRITLQY
jgi:hypothetical protein